MPSSGSTLFVILILIFSVSSGATLFAKAAALICMDEMVKILQGRSKGEKYIFRVHKSSMIKVRQPKRFRLLLFIQELSYLYMIYLHYLYNVIISIYILLQFIPATYLEHSNHFWLCETRPMVIYNQTITIITLCIGTNRSVQTAWNLISSAASDQVPHCLPLIQQFFIQINR